jgi:hypothetical protein
MRTLLFGLAALLLAACNTTIDVAQYDQSCSVAADCVAVYTGALCQVCGGGDTAAINVSAKSKYDADAKALSGGCPPRFGPQPACSPREPRTPVCTAGACGLAPL